MVVIVVEVIERTREMWLEEEMDGEVIMDATCLDDYVLEKEIDA